MNFLRSFFKPGLCGLFIFLLPLSSLQAQDPVPDMEPVFKDDVVPRIDIIISEGLLDQILAPGNEESDVEHPATFIFDNGVIRDTVELVGFRLRGNTSRYSGKKSFKVAFDSFEDGKDYKGLEKLNLNGEHNDPSIIRAKLCWDLLRDMGVPAPRANHVELYINGDYFGLYINVEHIDEEFAELRFGDKDGNLYKCLYPADLVYRGASGDDYKHTSGDRRVYELVTNESEDNYDNLAQFIDIINNTPTNQLRETLEPVFNVNSYLKSLAVEIITGQWDGYSWLNNNYYLYENPRTGKIEYIHYDMDNTFGIDWFGIDWANRDLYNWKNDNEPRPLYTRMMEVQTYRDRLSFYITELLENYFLPSTFNPRIDQIKSMIQASAEADTYRTIDYGFTIDDFNTSYNTGLGAHVVYGVKEYVTDRYYSALNQLETFDLSPVIWSVENSQVVVGEPVTFSSRIEDDNSFDAELNYIINGQALQTVPMLDDGLNGDEAAGDDIFSAQLAGLSPPVNLEYYVTAQDISANTSRKPVAGNLQINISDADAVPLFINEFMADNDNTKADEAGEFDDWFEIYNGGSTSIYLGDKYLTDKLSNPDKWQMPDVSIGPGEFILFWADEDQEQGIFHTNFKLSADGEEIGIFYGEGYGFLEIHSVVFGPQDTDVSTGLVPDGTEPYIQLPFSTPGRSNVVTGLDDEFTASLKIWPNPANDHLMISHEAGFKDAGISLFTTTGQELLNQAGFSGNQIQIDLGSLQGGVYVLRITQRDRVSSFRILKF